MITMDDKYRLKDFGLIAEVGHENPITPKIENKTLPIPGRAGLWDFGSEIKEKEISIPVACVGHDRINLQQKLNDFVAFLCDEFGKPREIKVVFDYEKDKFYTVKLAEQLNPERIIHLGRFMLPFVANDPFKYSRLFGDEIVWGSKVVTFEWHYLLGHEGDDASSGFKVTSPTTVNVNVDGIAVQPVFEINGTTNNLKIECGKYSFTLPNFSNAKWIIDFEKYTVTRNGQEQILDGINDFFLMPGNNAIKIISTFININIKIKHKDKYN